MCKHICRCIIIIYDVCVCVCVCVCVIKYCIIPTRVIEMFVAKLPPIPAQVAHMAEEWFL